MNIQDYYKYSWFSTLAYVDWRGISINASDPGFPVADASNPDNPRIPGSVSTPEIDTLGEKIFSPVVKGGQGWRVTSFQPNDTTGFKASLFEKSDTHEKILAVCGTEPSSWDTAETDLWIASLQQIGEYGMAVAQAVKLYNYVQRLLAAPGADVQQLEFEKGLLPPTPGTYSGSYITVPGNPVQFLWVKQTWAVGVGEGLLHYGDNVTLTGHSLGGHLAAIGTRMFPALFNGAVTFNAPGIDAPAGFSNMPFGQPIISIGKQLTDTFFNTLFAPYLAEPPAASFAALGSRVQSMVSEDSVPGDDNSVVSSWVTGKPFSPRQPIVTERDSHMIEPIMDSLAVQSLLEQLKPNIGLPGAGLLLEAASNNPGRAEESILEALAKLFLNKTDPLPTKDVAEGITGSFWINPGDFGKRSTLHQWATEIENKLQALKSGGATFDLLSFATIASDFLAQKAGLNTLDGLATRYALNEGNPFAILGADYSAFNTAHELDLYDPATGQGEMTERYIQERAQMLAYWMRHNLTDGQRTVDPSLPANRYYEDVARNTNFIVDRTSNTSPTGIVKPMYVFGGEGNDVIFGNDDHDVLFGGLGMDRLDGAGGQDYLEGNVGSDILTGGEGADTLLGGTGDDLLEGGKGHDSLAGGLGDDTYLLNRDDGWDWIEDKDGAGHLEMDSVRLGQGLTYKAPNVWQQQDAASGKTFTYSLYAGSESGETFQILSIQGRDGGVWIKRWQDGQLGITLPGAPDPQVRPALDSSGGQFSTAWYEPRHTVTDTLSQGIGETRAQGDHGEALGQGWLVGNDFDNRLESGSSYTASRADWNVTRRAPESPILDFNQFSGSWYLDDDANDILRGGKGDDHLWGGSGADQLYGDEDNDELVGHDGGDELHGGSGNDTLVGDGAEAENPNWYILPQYHGDDILDGDAGDDWLAGDGGADLIRGGDGNDEIHGDIAGLAIEFQGNDTLEGGQGADQIWGDGGDDVITGGTEDDYLRGDSINAPFAQHGRDTLDGGEGNDTVAGDGGDDVVMGGAGNDTLLGDIEGIPEENQGNDLVLGGQGNDLVDGGAGDDTLRGEEDDDILWGQAGADVLDGGAGKDGLLGGEGADSLTGGGGTDLLKGEAGDDTYFFNLGDSPLTATGQYEGIVDDAGSNVVRFGAGIDIANVKTQLDTEGGFLIVDYSDADHLAIQNGYSGAIGRFEFAEGTSLTAGELLGRTADFGVSGTALDGTFFVYGGKQSDTLASGASRAQFHGGRGDDTLEGSGGNHTYTYERGDGNDTIRDTSAKTDASGQPAPNTLQFAAGITADELVLGREPGVLKIKGAGGQGEVLRIEGFDPEDALGLHPIDRYEFADGTVLTHAQLLARGFDLVGGASNDSLTGTSVDDRIDGGAGNDRMPARNDAEWRAAA